MKVTVLCKRTGEIESVAILSAAPSGRFHIEVEGGGHTEEIEVDERDIAREALLGSKGPEAQKKVYEKLQRRLRGAKP